MVLALFKFKVRPEAAAEFQETVHRMVELVSKMPGFLGMEMFQSEDGHMLAIPRFESEEVVRAWKNDPEHVAAQKKGREHFFEEYSIDICSTIRSYDFQREAGALRS